MEISGEGLAGFFAVMSPLLNERQRRLQAAAMVDALGRGGQARVAEATGMSRNTLLSGARELAGGAGPSERVRRPGAGPKRKIDVDTDLLVVLDGLVEPESRGDPMSPLRWTVKSTRQLAAELGRLGHSVGASLVGELLHYMGYSLQGNANNVNTNPQHRAAIFGSEGDPLAKPGCEPRLVDLSSCDGEHGVDGVIGVGRFVVP